MNEYRGSTTTDKGRINKISMDMAADILIDRIMVELGLDLAREAYTNDN